MAIDIKKVLSAYGILDFGKPKLITSEEEKMEYIIDDKYILEVNNSEYLTENKIIYINKLVDRYKEFGLLAPKYIANLDGDFIYSFENNYCLVKEYIPYKTLKESNVSYLDINKEVYDYIASYSTKYKNQDIFPFRTTHTVIDLSPLDSEVDEKQANLNMLLDTLKKAGFVDLKNKLEKFNENVRSELKLIFKKLPRCNYSGILTSRNIYIKDNHFAGFKNFEYCGSEVIVNYMVNEARPNLSEEDFLDLSAAEIRNKILNDHREKMAYMLKNYNASNEEKKALELYNKLLFISGFTYYNIYKNVLRTKNRNKVTTLLQLLIV